MSDAPTEMTPADLAVAMASGSSRMTERQVKRWLGVWFEKGVAGIRKVPSRGRYGFRWSVAPDLVTRWIACELPSPHPPREARPRVARPRTTPATTVTVTPVPSEPDALPATPTVSAEELRAMHTRSARATLAALEAILATGG